MRSFQRSQLNTGFFSEKTILETGITILEHTNEDFVWDIGFFLTITG